MQQMKLVDNLEIHDEKMDALPKEFATLRTRLPTLWSRSYYVDSVGKLNEYTIRKYIQEQDKQ